MALAHPVFQDPEPRDGRHQRRQGPSQRGTGQACASGARRRSVEFVAAGYRGGIRSSRPSRAARPCGRGIDSLHGNPGERRASSHPQRAAASRQSIAAAFRHPAGQARTAAAHAPAPWSGRLRGVKARKGSRSSSSSTCAELVAAHPVVSNQPPRKPARSSPRLK